MTNDQKIDIALGQIAVLKGICIALVVAHPEPEDLLPHLAHAGEIAIAKLLPTGASEEMISAVQKMNDDLLSVVKQEIARR